MLKLNSVSLKYWRHVGFKRGTFLGAGVTREDAAGRRPLRSSPRVPRPHVARAATNQNKEEELSAASTAPSDESRPQKT